MSGVVKITLFAESSTVTEVFKVAKVMSGEVSHLPEKITVVCNKLLLLA